MHPPSFERGHIGHRFAIRWRAVGAVALAREGLNVV